MGPKQRLAAPQTDNDQPDTTCCAGLTVRSDHHPRVVTETDLELDLEHVAPGRGPDLTRLADTLHQRVGGSRRWMLAVVLDAATLGTR